MYFIYETERKYLLKNCIVGSLHSFISWINFSDNNHQFSSQKFSEHNGMILQIFLISDSYNQQDSPGSFAFNDFGAHCSS